VFKLIIHNSETGKNVIINELDLLKDLIKKYPYTTKNYLDNYNLGRVENE